MITNSIKKCFRSSNGSSCVSPNLSKFKNFPYLPIISHKQTRPKQSISSIIEMKSNHQIMQKSLTYLAEYRRTNQRQEGNNKNMSTTCLFTCLTYCNCNQALLCACNKVQNRYRYHRIHETDDTTS